jgi:predicted DNA-binding transcriptional regulator AlpA
MRNKECNMEQDKDRADLLYGVPEIAEFMGRSTAAVYHLARATDFPKFKLGGTVCARRSSINAWLADLEAKARCG